MIFDIIIPSLCRFFTSDNIAAAVTLTRIRVGEENIRIDPSTDCRVA